MTEWLLASPAGIGVLAERGLTLSFNLRHRRSWRQEVQELTEWGAGFLGEIAGDSLVRQAERQVRDFQTFQHSPENIAAARLCCLKSLAAIAFAVGAALNFVDKDYLGTYQLFSVAFPFAIGAFFDGVKAGEDLDLEVVFNRELPWWQNFKKIL